AAALAACRGNPKRIGQAVADRSEFTDRGVAFRRPATHLGVEVSLMTTADDDVPVLRDDRIDGPDRLARIQHARFDVEWDRVRRLRCNAMRELLRADRRCRRLARAQFLVEAGKNGLDANKRIGPDVDVGGLLPVAQAARGVVQLDLESLWPEGPATDVIRKARADREHDISGLVDLP